ncbi:hypothetical protein SEA_HONK_79 [Microbacterium phage Honk]|uniref:Uncharacterized protein n=1 Tax=Microbacterium phage Honk TaxID=2836095 RepID=A0A8F3E6Z1_9CAUD|nr:hypothetical protein SEA_HONK_79 [Microbacterium phage Honk]
MTAFDIYTVAYIAYLAARNLRDEALAAFNAASEAHPSTLDIAEAIERMARGEELPPRHPAIVAADEALGKAEELFNEAALELGKARRAYELQRG